MISLGLDNLDICIFMDSLNGDKKREEERERERGRGREREWGEGERQETFA